MANPIIDEAPAIAAGKRIADVKMVPGGGVYAVLGAGDQVHDLERLLDRPRAVRQRVTAHDAASFAAYFNRFKADGKSVLFADRDEFTVTGILDYHNTEPAWCAHQVTYTAPRSTEWDIWSAANGRSMKQADFALFIENNVADIRTPPGADVLEVARNLQAKKAVDFSSAIRTSTGEQQFTYSETVHGTAQNGQLTVPEEFTLGIPVFRNDKPYAVRARLRYRIDAAKLLLWYDLYRPDVIIEDAFRLIVDDVAKATGVAVWQGEAP